MSKPFNVEDFDLTTVSSDDVMTIIGHVASRMLRDNDSLEAITYTAQREGDSKNTAVTFEATFDSSQETT